MTESSQVGGTTSVGAGTVKAGREGRFPWKCQEAAKQERQRTLGLSGAKAEIPRFDLACRGRGRQGFRGESGLTTTHQTYMNLVQVTNKPPNWVMLQEQSELDFLETGANNPSLERCQARAEDPPHPTLADVAPHHPQPGSLPLGRWISAFAP